MQDGGKRIVVIREVGGELFEAAYFVLRGDKMPIIDDENVTRDVVSEANRIIESSFRIPKGGRKRGLILPILTFIAGASVALIIGFFI